MDVGLTLRLRQGDVHPDEVRRRHQRQQVARRVAVGLGQLVLDEVEVVLAWEGLVRSEEHTSELQSLMRISYAVFCLKKKTTRQRCKHVDDAQRTTDIKTD